MTRSLSARPAPRSLEHRPSAAEARIGSVKLNIRELVVHGIAPGSRELMGQSIRDELTRLLAERGVPATLTRPHVIDCLRCGPIDGALGASPELLGEQIAKAVYGELK
jgi:hypothetical protein